MKKTLAISMALITGLAYGKNLTFPETYQIRTMYNYGEIKGFVQIPKGGAAGTATEKRPVFNELGIDNIGFTELDFQMNWKKLGIYTNIRHNKFDGSATLTEDLISHSNYFKKGSYLSTEHEYSNLTIGGMYCVYDNGKLRLKPKAEISLNDFKYEYVAKYEGEKDIEGSRKFGWGQLNLGLVTEYEVTDKYSLELNMEVGIPHDSVRKYYSVSLLNKYNLYSNEDKSLDLLFGIGYDKLKYRDTQDEMQNFMEHEISPVYKIGLEFTF